MAIYDPDLEEIAQQYLRSSFVREVCVLRSSSDAAADAGAIFAVIVPHMEMIRSRRIVNIGDLLRFEVEGQSVYLPEHKRLRRFEIWFEPLPRTASGAFDRGSIERRLEDARQNREARTSDVARVWGEAGERSEVLRAIARQSGGEDIRPESNLEIDLGLDSMQRVELLAELERRFGWRLPPDRAHEVLTAGQLLEALERIEAPTPEATDDMWAVLLRDLPDASDPLVRPLLERHVMKWAFHVFLRVVRFLIAPLRVSGLEHVPRTGAFILSPNHQSFLDPFFVCAALPYRVVRDLFAVGATEYFETPAMAWAARQLNLVRVDPDSNLVPAMRAAAFGLQQRRILILFPEGERSIDGRVKRFKKGASILSRQLDVPIVPVALRGLFELWPRNRAFNWRVLLPWSGHRIEIAFAAPVRFDRDRTYAASAAALQQRVTDLCESPQELRDEHRAGDAAGE